MKKLFILSALISIIGFSSTISAGGGLEEGSMIVDAFYGFPDGYKSVLTGGTNDDADASSVGPFGAKFEYLISEKIGFGVVVGYGSTIVEWDESSYDYKVSVPRSRIMGSFNYHFGSMDSFDPYFMTAIGYATSSINVESNDPYYTDESVDISGLNYALRVAFGARYFFTDMFGAHLELGLGSGAIMQAGVSAKF